jgi:hypothetical protein
MANKPLDEEGMGPLEQGRGRYQRKDYTGALESFAQVGSLSRYESTNFLSLAFVMCY